MAGERKGDGFEALVCLALEELGFQQGGNLFWGEKPPGFSIDPDFILGELQNPTHWILATSSGSGKNSLEKFWRNVGELFEVKRSFKKVPKVINLVFEAQQRVALQHAMSCLADSEVIVANLALGKQLQEMIDENIRHLPKEKEEKKLFLHKNIYASKVTAKAFSEFKDELRNCLSAENTQLKSLWTMLRNDARQKKKISARSTFVRRGLAKLMLFGGNQQKQILDHIYERARLKQLPGAAVSAGMASKTIGGYRLTDSDILSATECVDRESVTKVLAAGYQARPDNWNSWRNEFSESDPESYNSYVLEHYSDLITANGMHAHLAAHSPNGYKWLFTYLMEILKAHSGKRQGYGYSVLARDVGYSKGISSGYLELADWINGFIDEPKSISLLRDVASALSERLSDISSDEVFSLSALVATEALRNLIEQKVVSYWLFEPLPLLIKFALDENGITFQYVKKHPTVIGELVGDPRGTAAPTVIRVGGNLIVWRSAYDLGRHHKTKELCGRVQALRFQYVNGRFTRRSDVESLILIVDGTFNQEQLATMQEAGWDAIFYPDEMDKLIKALV